MGRASLCPWRMTMREHILLAEARANAARLPITRLCATAGISRAAWYRWKNDLGEAGLITWQRVQQVLRDSEQR